ncbi:MAG: Omp28-related outer membrane protein [Bacteroidia bacterium]|nr:Omp28-related outer membrane protein [Bacteroidia bacterium]
MKKVLLLMIPALLIGFAGCKKDKKDDGGDNSGKTTTTKPVQNVMMFYFGGTWCGPCGAYGKPTIQAAKKINERVHVVSCQVNGAGGATDPFNNAHSTQLAGVFSVKGVPTLFIADGNGQIASFSGGASMQSSTTTKVNEILSKTDPDVYAKPVVKLDGDNITVTINAQFYKDFSDEYRFAVYITESRLQANQYQDGRTEDKNMHDDVLRLSLTTEVVGDVVASSVTKGTKISKTYTGTLDANWKKENLKAVVVFWRKTGDNQVTFVNGEYTKIK